MDKNHKKDKEAYIRYKERLLESDASIEKIWINDQGCLVLKYVDSPENTYTIYMAAINVKLLGWDAIAI